jgi:uncharacterized protein (DUF924 family)
MAITPQDILDYWYSPRLSKHWFSSTPELDAEITDRYQSLWEQAAAGALDDWMDTPEGSLALAIILDQFPLNMFRGQAKSFSTEARAIAIAKHAIDSAFDRRLDKDRLAFLYMPLMHSENLADQDMSVKLFGEAGLIDNHRFAEHHRDIVRRFGRFPHRNGILGRASTAAELQYLASEGAFTG